MSSRHTRRKAAKAKQLDKLLRLAQAERAKQVGMIVRANKSKPIERNYYPASPMGNLGEYAARGNVGGHSTGVSYKSTPRPRWKG